MNLETFWEFIKSLENRDVLTVTENLYSIRYLTNSYKDW